MGSRVRISCATGSWPEITAATASAPPLRARRPTAALHNLDLLSSSRVFEAMDRSLSRRPRAGCEARVQCRTCLCWGVRRAARRPTTTAAGWPHDFSGAFGHEARALFGLLSGLTDPWPCALAALCFGVCAARGGAARMGRLVLWRICGAVVGRRRWSEGLDAALEKYQSGVDALYGRLPRVAAHLVVDTERCRRQRTRPIATKTCR